MPNNHPTYFPRRANLRVNNLAYSSEVNINGQTRCELGQPVAANVAGIMSAVSIANAITKGGTFVTTFDPDLHMGRYGRNVTVALSGAGTPTVTVRGRDYLGQPIAEDIVAAGATTVAGKKAFKTVDNISVGAVAATTLNLGYGNVLGLPYAIVKVTDEFQDDAVASAGTIVLASAAAQTATSADPRGSYLPASVPNGTRKYDLIGLTLYSQLHGVPHYYA